MCIIFSLQYSPSLKRLHMSSMTAQNVIYYNYLKFAILCATTGVSKMYAKQKNLGIK